MDTTTPSENTRPIKTAKPADKRGWWWGTGRRKTAVARVRLRPVSGQAGQTKFTIVRPDDKTKTVEEFFSEARDRADCYAALKATSTDGRFEVVARVHGGGFMGQAQAIRLGVARALVAMDPALDPVLRDLGMLTRDAREVERKKYGQAGARRRFQFSKR